MSVDESLMCSFQILKAIKRRPWFVRYINTSRLYSTSSCCFHSLLGLECGQLPQVLFEFSFRQSSERLALSNNSNLHWPFVNLTFFWGWFRNGSQGVKNQTFEIAQWKSVKMGLEVSSCWLRTSANSIGKVLIIVSAWACLKEMRSILIISSY